MIKRGILNHPGHFLDRLVRHPWIIGGFALVSALGMVAASAVATAPPLPADLRQVIVEQLEIAAATPVPQGDQAFFREERIERGDNLGKLLSRLGVEEEEARRFILRSPEVEHLHRQLIPGKIVSASTTSTGDLLSFHFPMGTGDGVTIIERHRGQLSVREESPHYETQVQLKSGQIRQTLFGATDAAGIPDSIAIQMAEIFSSDIDFHRDLRRGDRFTLVYEMQYYQGQPARSGRILSAEFTNDGQTHQAIYFEQDGKGSYFGADGKNRKKAFLRSPLEFSRVTSGFALRFHPILREWRAHKGVDYGAPTGTKIRATGDGIVEFVGNQGGYGNLVILSHGGNYQTAYAHMSDFASELRKGSRINQGDLVGYVGQTGWATGPHLHYEFRVQGDAIDPLSVAIPTAMPLEHEELSRFKGQSQEQLAMLKLLKEQTVAYFE